MEDPSAAGGPRRDEIEGRRPEAEGLSPVRAFFLLGAVAAMIPLGLLATKDEAAPSEAPATVRSPDFSLTDAEAIAEFKRLKGVLVEAYRHRDLSLLGMFATSGSPFARRVESEIRALLRDGVVDATTTTTHRVVVASNQPTRVEILETATERPRFRDARTGVDVTVASGAQRQTVRWILERVDLEWRIDGAVITSVDEAPKRKGPQA